MKGLPPQVFRVSVRKYGGFLGYLTSFFNVPGVFGSIPYQSNNYIGSDCCDVLTAAYGKWKGKVITKDYNVDMLVSRLPKRATANITVRCHGQNTEMGPGNAIRGPHCS